jgi:hypothetical protein
MFTPLIVNCNTIDLYLEFLCDVYRESDFSNSDC